MNIEEAKEIFAAGWPDSQKMQRKFDAGNWLISEVGRLEKRLMALTEDQRSSFHEASKPLIQWLNENCHPHVVVIVENDGAELLEGVCSFKTHDIPPIGDGLGPKNPPRVPGDKPWA